MTRPERAKDCGSEMRNNLCCRMGDESNRSLNILLMRWTERRRSPIGNSRRMASNQLRDIKDFMLIVVRFVSL